MFNADDFQYAMENTQVIVSPERRIETFGNVNFRFYLISELMDEVNHVRIRDGRIEAQRPEILTAESAPGCCSMDSGIRPAALRHGSSSSGKTWRC